MYTIRQFLISFGHPLYLLLKFLIPPPLRLRGGVRGGDTRKRSYKEVTIYHAPKKKSQKKLNLKYILKRIYPLIKRFPKLHIPKIKISFNKKIEVSIIAIIFLGTTTYFYLLKDLPSASNLNTPPPLTTHILDRNGKPLYKIYASENRTLVKLSDLPISLKESIIAIEDKDFYRHAGFSPSGTVRAVWRIIVDRKVEGGSTITQQLVKNVLLNPDRTLKRKLRELILAIVVEHSYSKDQILEMYLNRVSFGGASYGIEEASQTYFGKPAKLLTLPESAMLAGLPASPTTYSPFGAHPELAKQRQREVLKRMVEDGYITQTQAEQASAQEIILSPQRIDIQAPHFVMYIKDILAQIYGTKMVEQGGLTVTTSLDLDIQNMAQEIVKNEVDKVSYLHIGNGAALVTSPKTGEILAMVGSKDYWNTKDDGNVNVTTSLRQPGSSIKPINYALALTRGFTTSSIIDDSPISYKSPNQPVYTPVNYDGKYHGRIPLRIALASSYNIPAVKVLAANGVTNMIDLGRKMGITTWNDSSRFGLSLTLGGGEVTMIDMATAYGVFANLGQKVDLQSILSITNSNGKILQEKVLPQKNLVLDPKVAYLISSILSDNSARAPAFGFNSDLNLPNTAVKTGTTNNLRDNWTIGYTPNLLTAVWVGNNDGSSMSYVASGVTGASPIWRHIMDELIKKYPSSGFTPPPDLIKVNICTITGELTCEGCPTRTDFFVPGTEPKTSCSPENIKKIIEDKAQKAERDTILQGASTP
ncbi:MAG: Penicillin-binding protein, 1A family [Candidatus Amesbacteria bacterium GW2011_GWA2_42_12]|uniref:Penicillin-binding protein, 1A family n=1 Tax=Candidatus Amesbacteria bacterium GW2011_GWA2_42_12 TaxID=1618356 RepID=A0A0G0Y7K9_9BACT|nr:MAG: Penicillin-binding protein, 1A family [Candidatus Amesbacteria bacterium GW2011_GWA2_42_12]